PRRHAGRGPGRRRARPRRPGRPRRGRAARAWARPLRPGPRPEAAPRDRGRRSPALRGGSPPRSARGEPELAARPSAPRGPRGPDRPDGKDPMINAARLKDEFLELVSISSPSRREGRIARRLEGILKGMGASVEVDG